jgi:hypothetical protein
MKTVGGEKHLIADGTPADIYDARLSDALDSEIFENITELRKRSNVFLNEALALKQLELS